MISVIRRYVETFAELRVLVIGEAMLDSYLIGTAGRICREAPVPVVDLLDRRDTPGGAANTAANVRSLGAQVLFLSVTGDDHEGELLRQTLHECSVSTDHLLTQASRRTLAKHRIVAGSQILARFDQGSTCPVDYKTERSIIARLTNLFPRCDAVVVSDYDYGVLTPRVIDTLARLQARHPRVLVVDSKRLPAYRHVRPTAVKPNHDEAVKLLGSGVFAGFQSRADSIAAEGERLLDISGAKLVAVTLDTEGTIIIERDGPPYRTYAQPIVNARTVGAGDTFAGTLALALAACARPHIAAELASAAAHIVVAKDGTAACSAEELCHRFFATDKLVSDPSLLASRVETHRQQGRRIVLTSGCFDILHPGHVTFLNRAKALGDLLIVGVNSGPRVRTQNSKLKTQNSDSSAQALATLSCIDHLIPFDQDTAANLIRAIRPDVFVQGGDYSLEDLPEAQVVREVGGVVRILPYLYEGPGAGIAGRVPEVSAVPGAHRHAGDAGVDANDRPRKPFVVVANDQAYA